LEPDAVAFSAAFAEIWAPHWRGPSDRLSPLPEVAPSALALSARGLRAVDGLAVPVEALEQLDERLRAAPRDGGGAALDDATLAALGWARAEAEQILRGLGYARVRPAAGEAVPAWRRRTPKTPRAAKGSPTAASPFAALAALSQPPARRPRRRRPRRAAS
jgi:ATP-dependent RNA helicase SUPV3L1/SUV3